MKKVIINTILILMIMLSTSVFAIEFTDLNSNHWAVNYIYSMQQTNIINGYEDGTFKPENQVKTGEFIKMVAMAMWPDYKYEAPKPDEADGTHWAKPYVFTLHKVTLDANDYDDARMERIITREEVTNMACKLYLMKHDNAKLNRDNEDLLKKFSDESEVTDTYNRLYVENCVKYGIISGFPDGTFRAKEGLTRAQAAKVIYMSLYNE